jgi:hypothetical protein
VRALRRTLPFVLLLVLLPLSASAGRFTLVPSLVVTGEWTDNLLLTPEESDHAKLSDFSVTAFPGLALTYDSYRTHAFVGAGVGFRHYFRYDQFDGWPEYYNGTAGWAYWLSPLRPAVLDVDQRGRVAAHRVAGQHDRRLDAVYDHAALDGRGRLQLRHDRISQRIAG